MNKALRNSLIALAVCIGIGLMAKFVIFFLGFYGIWHQPVFKPW